MFFPYQRGESLKEDIFLYKIFFSGQQVMHRTDFQHYFAEWMDLNSNAAIPHFVAVEVRNIPLRCMCLNVWFCLALSEWILAPLGCRTLREEVFHWQWYNNYSRAPRSVWFFCVPPVVEGLISQLPDPITCCHVSTAAMDSHSGSIKPNKLPSISFLGPVFCHSSRKSPKYSWLFTSKHIASSADPH